MVQSFTRSCSADGENNGRSIGKRNHGNPKIGQIKVQTNALAIAADTGPWLMPCGV